MNLAIYDTECERLVADLLEYMTPEEKAGQLAMCSAPPVDDREATDVLVDDIQQGRVGCIHSIADRDQADFFQGIAREETRLGIPLLFPEHTGRGFDTVLPGPLAAAASWDPDSVEMAEAIIAQEAEARGINWALGPDVVLSRAPDHVTSLSSGEDAHLAASMAIARIRGLQGAAPNSEANLPARMDLSGAVPRDSEGEFDPVALLRLASMAIVSGHVASLSIDGLSASRRREIGKALRVLDAPGGFDGIMLTHWQDIARAAGDDDVDVSRDGVPYNLLVKALRKGSVDRQTVDAAVARVLRTKFRHGLLGAALAAPRIKGSHVFPTPVHNREAALTLARRCPVLVRNDPPLLPLGIDSGDVLIVGPAASDRHSPMPDATGVAASVIDGLEQLGIPHRYVPGLALRENGSPIGGPIAADSMAIGMANEAAKRAGTVILVLANDEQGRFGEAQEQLLGALANTNPNLVLVNIGPRPVDPWIGRGPIASILHAGQLGMMSGHAIGELLAGEFAPCGKLPVTIPPSCKSPGLPFGHGLNYADFALTNLAIERGRDRLHAFVDLRNVSEREGTEVVQVYIRRTGSNGTEAPLELVDFQRLSLGGGQIETLVFDIGREELGRHAADGSFHVETGPVELFVGLSSQRGMTSMVEIGTDYARAIAHSGVHPPASGGPDGERRRA